MEGPKSLTNKAYTKNLTKKNTILNQVGHTFKNTIFFIIFSTGVYADEINKTILLKPQTSKENISHSYYYPNIPNPGIEIHKYGKTSGNEGESLIKIKQTPGNNMSSLSIFEQGFYVQGYKVRIENIISFKDNKEKKMLTGAIFSPRIYMELNKQISVRFSVKNSTLLDKNQNLMSIGLSVNIAL